MWRAALYPINAVPITINNGFELAVSIVNAMVPKKMAEIDCKLIASSVDFDLMKTSQIEYNTPRTMSTGKNVVPEQYVINTNEQPTIRSTRFDFRFNSQ